MDLRSQTVLDSGGSLDLVKASSVHDGDPRIASSTPQCNGPQKPAIAAKKPTRQWAAWTHQEEESFFTALRQVGKNFEKITRRVQTKNKDQVRHYYYRLVRRMKKLLGPELSLDAKNSKDTNAAMLRWWSLLEKYSCKASKLHLKPRRFKIFIEALENQLMKDRKKNVKKQPSLGENTSPMMPGSITNHNRPPSNDPQIVKLVLVDSQNIQKPGTGRGPVKRNVNIGVIRGKKGDSTLIKPTRQRRKQGVASSAAYKKWEKAAIAGVSLVADAAEHLERAATDGEFQNEQAMPENKYDDNNAQTTLKLKLQLFPIDDATQRSLEMDKHNPHLELTLSTRKKISSVMEHLNKKWGNSSAAGRQLMLFPYFAQKESLMGCQGWSQESVASAADVYMAVGSPPVFRLRYGWFSDNDFALSNRKNSSSADQTFRGETVGLGNGMDNVRELVPSCGMSINDPSPNTVSSKRFELTAVNNNDTPTTPAFDAPSKMNGEEAKNELIHSPSVVQWCKNDSGLRTINKEYEVDGPRLSNGATISQGEWADSLTNISIGDLLSEVSPVVDHNCTPPAPTQSDLYLHQTPFSCDSFDAAIAAHLLKHQKTVLPSTEAPQTYSIWDAEETCDAFAFQKSVVLRQEAPTSSAIPSLRAEKQVLKTSSVVTDVSIEELHGMDFLAEKKLTDDSGSDSQSSGAVAKDFSGLTDIYWPDSLGPLDVDLLTPKYHGDDLILSDSLSGFNRLLANSLDAFQNCSFFTGQEGLITRS